MRNGILFFLKAIPGIFSLVITQKRITSRFGILSKCHPDIGIFTCISCWNITILKHLFLSLYIYPDIGKYQIYRHLPEIKDQISMEKGFFSSSFCYQYQLYHILWSENSNWITTGWKINKGTSLKMFLAQQQMANHAWKYPNHHFCTYKFIVLKRLFWTQFLHSHGPQVHAFHWFSFLILNES